MLRNFRLQLAIKYLKTGWLIADDVAVTKDAWLTILNLMYIITAIFVTRSYWYLLLVLQ